MRSLLRSALALGVVAALFTACGDDELPAAGTSPCLDANTACNSIRLTPDNVTYNCIYDGIEDETTHSLSWPVDNVIVSGYGPGKRMMLTFTFDPPMMVGTITCFRASCWPRGRTISASTGLQCPPHK